MFKRFSLAFLTMILAIATLFIAAKNSVGDNVISFDQPEVMKISIGIVVLLFLPPLILSFFNNNVVKVINAAYQAFIVLTFLGLIPVGFMIPNGMMTIIISILGTIVSIASVFVVIFNTPKTSNSISYDGP
ncbi:hypothetical protein [Exiguobacterium sp. ZOR0005]|uniref:hypothetical protein n=1 Tax=Exiguobacterium sp. ZOR0005 TaxID=1339226 RepID=UPI00046283F6|nr:hypothetical protein [Exiguobacterium sp. ZOR0005]